VIAGFVVLAVVALFVVVVLFGARRAPNVVISCDGELLRIDLGGYDALLAVRRSLVVPLDQVRGVAVADASNLPARGLRIIGTSLPGVVRAGTFGLGADRSFWDIRNPDRVLWIEFNDRAPYRRAILEVPDPHATMLALRPQIGAWLPGAV